MGQLLSVAACSHMRPYAPARRWTVHLCPARTPRFTRFRLPFHDFTLLATCPRTCMAPFPMQAQPQAGYLIIESSRSQQRRATRHRACKAAITLLQCCTPLCLRPQLIPHSTRRATVQSPSAEVARSWREHARRTLVPQERYMPHGTARALRPTSAAPTQHSAHSTAPAPSPPPPPRRPCPRG